MEEIVLRCHDHTHRLQAFAEKHGISGTDLTKDAQNQRRAEEEQLRAPGVGPTCAGKARTREHSRWCDHDL